ncbi:MAG: hypothetical protein ABIV50_03190, partial [Opitutus sp.]
FEPLGLVGEGRFTFVAEELVPREPAGSDAEDDKDYEAAEEVALGAWAQAHGQVSEGLAVSVPGGYGLRRNEGSRVNANP